MTNQHSLVWSIQDDIEMAIYTLRGDHISVLRERFPDKSSDALANRMQRIYLTGPRGRVKAREIIRDNDGIEYAKTMGVDVDGEPSRAQPLYAVSGRPSSPAMEEE